MPTSLSPAHLRVLAQAIADAEARRERERLQADLAHRYRLGYDRTPCVDPLARDRSERRATVFGALLAALVMAALALLLAGCRIGHHGLEWFWAPQPAHSGSTTTNAPTR